MPVPIEALFAGLDRVAEELSDEDAAVALAEIGLGWFFWSKPETATPPVDQLVEMSAAGQMYQQGRTSLKCRIDYLTSELHTVKRGNHPPHDAPDGGLLETRVARRPRPETNSTSTASACRTRPSARPRQSASRHAASRRPAGTERRTAGQAG